MSTLMPRRTTRRLLSLLPGLAAVLLTTAAAATPRTAYAADAASTQALEEVKGRKDAKNVIQNKFFLKQNRFEIAPALGYVPNNAFVSVPVGGAFLAYHFTEGFAVEGSVFYAPNTGNAGVKNLTETLVSIAYEGSPDAKFQQPLDRLQLGAIFDARWAPVYGKINLIGEGVLNFDFYGTAGLGLLLITKDYATISDEYAGGDTTANPVQLEAQPQTTSNVAVNLGVGFDFFLTQTIALKLDARSALYVAKEPDYGNKLENGEPEPLENRLYNTFITTAGVSIFIPKMKPRIYNF
jgi:outer membrane beta-barrel protein